MKRMHIFHRWTKWSEPEIRRYRRKFADPNLVGIRCDKLEQVRKCETCNLQQRREVKRIYESGTYLSD